MEQTTRTSRRDAYLAALTPYLDDLDGLERAEVLDELAAALDETAAEHDGSLEEVLGTPGDYIGAYRSSAGLGPHEPAAAPRRRRLRTRAAAWIRMQPWWPRAVRLGELLRPSWWTLRGAALAALVGVMLGLLDELTAAFTLPGAIITVTGVALSMAAGAGRTSTRGRRLLHRVVNIVAVLVVVALLNAVAMIRDGAFANGWSDGFDAGLQAAVEPREPVEP